jgi:thiosulfate/3-mercaptopyruvate sulfurtransferase
VIAVLMVVVTVGYTDWWGHEAEDKGYVNASLLVSGRELNDHLGEAGIRIMDVRAAGRYVASHIPGSINLPIGEITRTLNGVPGMLSPIEEVEQALGRRGVTRDTRLVIVDDIGGVPATRLFWVLDYLGHSQMSVLQGGFKMWRQEGRPTTRQIPKVEGARYEGNRRPNLLADRAWVQARLEDPSIVLVDARSSQEFDGMIPGREINRQGHIPGAVSVDWNRNLTEEPRQFKSGSKLARIYGKAGATPDKEVVVYCLTGMRASHDYFVLRLLGYPRIRLYDGSYVEWSAKTTLPVAR